MNIDQAVAALGGDPIEDQVEDVAEDTADESNEAEISEGGPNDLQSDDEDAPEEASEDDVDENEEDDAPEEASEAPEFWDKEGKDKFLKWSPEVQEEILKYDRTARAAVAKHIQTAAEARKVAEQEAVGFREENTRVKSFLDDAALTLTDKYAGINWDDYFARDPQNAARHLKQRNADMARFTELRSEWVKSQDTVNFTEHREFLTNESAKLQELASTDPVSKKLLDPVYGDAERMEVAKYLIGLGVSQDEMKSIGAIATIIAHKAYLLDKGQNALTAKKSQASEAKTHKPQNSGKMRPSQKPGNPSTSATKANNRFAQTRSKDDAAAALLALDNSKK